MCRILAEYTVIDIFRMIFKILLQVGYWWMDFGFISIHQFQIKYSILFYWGTLSTVSIHFECLFKDNLFFSKSWPSKTLDIVGSQTQLPS